jgi:predicted phage tail protein
MGFDANALLLSMLIGSIGFVALVYGKKQSRLPQMVAGVTLMAFPYFVSNVWVMLGIAVAVVGAMLAAIRAGA